MRTYLLAVLLIISMSLDAQDSDSSRTEVIKVQYGTSVTVDNLRLEFKALSPDSRCPKEVTCIRGGDAVVSIDVYVDNILSKELRVTFYPYGASEELSKFLEANGILLKNLKLFPYPKADEKQVSSNYYFSFSALFPN